MSWWHIEYHNKSSPLLFCPTVLNAISVSGICNFAACASQLKSDNKLSNYHYPSPTGTTQSSHLLLKMGH